MKGEVAEEQPVVYGCLVNRYPEVPVHRCSSPAHTLAGIFFYKFPARKNFSAILA